MLREIAMNIVPVVVLVGAIVWFLRRARRLQSGALQVCTPTGSRGDPIGIFILLLIGLDTAVSGRWQKWGGIYEGPLIRIAGGLLFMISAVTMLRMRRLKRKTEPNQSPQRNAGSRPFSDDSPASESSSALGPRG